MPSKKLSVKEAPLPVLELPPNKTRVPTSSPNLKNVLGPTPLPIQMLSSFALNQQRQSSQNFESNLNQTTQHWYRLFNRRGRRGSQRRINTDPPSAYLCALCGESYQSLLF